MFHLDWYRLDRVEGADARLASECFDAQAVSLVEWASRGAEWLPAERINVAIRHKGADRRSISVSARGARPSVIVGSLKKKNLK